jgi:glycerophosphoryl diester phosphodiesterase
MLALNNKPALNKIITQILKLYQINLLKMKLHKLLRIVFLCLISMVLLQPLVAQTRHVDTILNDFYHRPEHVLVAAHRSAHLVNPENSLSAIKDAIEIGADIIEVDVRKTKDGVYVLLHDENIDRTTTAKGKVSDYTYDELKAIPLLQNGQPTNERIPTFESALRAAKDRIMVDIDFKLDSTEDAINVCKLIREAGMQQQVMFFVYDYHYISTLDSIDNSIPVMPRAYNKEDVLDILQTYKVPVIHGDPSFYNDTLMGQIRNHNVRVWINALGKFDELEKVQKHSGYDSLLEMKNVNVIQTDYPANLLQYLQERGLHR